MSKTQDNNISPINTKNKDAKKVYLCIDLKSFYASVECTIRGLNPLTTNLVVADRDRTEKTICLAVTPSLKAYGISGRPRLFEVVQKVLDINKYRRASVYNHKLTDKSYDAEALLKNPNLELDYIVAKPQMAQYIKKSAEIYGIYLKYVAKEDILVYSIDEVFMDITGYLSARKLSAKKLAEIIIQDVYQKTGITATAGIGTNMYLAKVAMDITAKKMKPDKNGVRVAELDEMSYRRELWEHTPITDFWRVGHGTAKRLEKIRVYTMGDVAQLSINANGRRTLKKLFGINAKLLIDHAWGYEPCTMADVRAYVPVNKSLGAGQVLQEPYTTQKARIVVWEMAEELALSLVEKRLLTQQLVLTVGYEAINTKNSEEIKNYQKEITTDRYGRKIPKHAHGTVNLDDMTSSTKEISTAVLKLYDEIVDCDLAIRRVNIAATKIVTEKQYQNDKKTNNWEQADMFMDLKSDKERKIEEIKQKNKKISQEKERKLQETMIILKNLYGKNAVIKGANLQDGATGIERNKQIGGHKA